MTARMPSADLPRNEAPRPPLRRRCGLLSNAWYAALRSEQLGSRPVQRLMLGELVVLFRDRAGSARALTDRCPHRNALLSEGRVVQGRLRCPYHGWTFDGAGRCVHIPSQGPGAPDTERRTEAFPALEQDGIVWVWMGSSGSEPSAPPLAMPYFRAAGYRSYYMETHFDSDVTNLVENFMDVPHTVYVHDRWFRSERRKRVPITVERGATSVRITYHDPQDSIGWSERILNPKRLPLTHTDLFTMPNHTRVDYVYGENEVAFVITSTCTPMTDDSTRVFTLISYKLGRFGRLASLLLPWYTRLVIRQDVGIMAVQRQALRHYGRSQFQSTRGDTPHLYIESLRNWAARGGTEPPPSPARVETEIWI